MKERVMFVLEWERRWKAGAGRLNFAELCREFGISRQVGYVWLGRHRGLILQHRRRVRETGLPTRRASRNESRLLSENALHLLASGELVDELVHVTNLLHQRIGDVLNAHAANDAGDE
jgi:hypothetical protein